MDALILMWFPTYDTPLRKDGLTPLHVAAESPAGNDGLMVELLLQSLARWAWRGP